MVKLTKNKSDNDKNILELNNTQDVLSLVRLMVPKDFRHIESRKLAHLIIVRIKKTTKSNFCFYMLLSDEKSKLAKIMNQIKVEIEENINIPLEIVDYNYSDTLINGVSKIKVLANYSLVLFKFIKLKDKNSKIQKLFSQVYL